MKKCTRRSFLGFMGIGAAATATATASGRKKRIHARMPKSNAELGKIKAQKIVDMHPTAEAEEADCVLKIGTDLVFAWSAILANRDDMLPCTRAQANAVIRMQNAAHRKAAPFCRNPQARA